MALHDHFICLTGFMFGGPHLTLTYCIGSLRSNGDIFFQVLSSAGLLPLRPKEMVRKIMLKLKCSVTATHVKYSTCQYRSKVFKSKFNISHQRLLSLQQKELLIHLGCISLIINSSFHSLNPLYLISFEVVTVKK